MTQPADVRLVVETRLNAALAALKSEILGGADPAFDTLLELQQALGDDANFASTVTNELASKVEGTDPRLSDARTPTAHEHTASTDLTATGSPSNLTFLRGDDVWAAPYSGMTQTEAEVAGEGAVRVISPVRLKAAIQYHAKTARVDAAPATWYWAGTALPTAASEVHAQARVGDFIVAPNLTTDPGWHRITGV